MVIFFSHQKASRDEEHSYYERNALKNGGFVVQFTLFGADIYGVFTTGKSLIFVVPYIMLNSEIIPTRCNNCVYSSQWLYSTCFG